MSDESGDRVMSRQEIATQMQAAFELCATCAHVRSSHEGGLEECNEEWHQEGEKRVCPCGEFWEWRREHLDGLRIVDREVAFGGAAGLLLNSRVPSDLWDNLMAGHEVALTVVATVEGKGYRVQRHEGEIVGVIETRKVKVKMVAPAEEGAE